MSFKIWSSGPKLGTPENPEIIDPRLPEKQPGRWRFVLQLLTWMLSVSLPAAFFDSLWLWLFDTAYKQGDLFAWVLLFLCTPAAFLFTLMAGIADLVLLFLIAVTLSGKSVRIENPRFARFVPRSR